MGQTEDIGQMVKINTETNNVEEVVTKDNKRLEFEELCRPLIKWINDNYNPHTKAIIDCGGCELVEGIMGIPIIDYIKD